MSETLFTLDLDDVIIKVEIDGTGYLVTWEDQVINTWHHKFHSLSETFQFLTNLMICKESGWELFLDEKLCVANFPKKQEN